MNSPEYLFEIDGNRRINIYTDWNEGAEKYAFSSRFVIGGANKTVFKNSTLNKTEMRLLIDTRNQWTYVIDQNCTSCINKNSSRYIKNPNTTFSESLSINNVSNTNYCHN